MARYYSQPMISDIEIAARERLVERLQSVVPITKPHDPSNCVEAWNWLVEQAQQAASTITAKEAEIAELRAERDEAIADARKVNRDYHELSRENLANYRRATHLRKGIETLLNNEPADQSLERVRDRLKAILEEAGTAGEATDLRERVRVLEEALRLYGSHNKYCSRPARPDCDCGWDEMHRNLLEAKTDG